MSRIVTTSDTRLGISSASGVTGASGSSSATTILGDPIINGLIAPEGKGIIGRISSHDSWNNHTYNDSLGNPSSSGPWTTYYNYAPYSDNSAIQFVNMALGDGYGNSGTSEWMFGASGYATSEVRNPQFANGNRVGHSTMMTYQRNNQSTGGYNFAIMPIRNQGTSSKTVSVYSYSSNYWNQGYEGRCLFYFTPNTNKYSTCSSVAGNNISNSNYSGNGAQYSQSGSFTIEPGKTVLVCQSSTDWYYTTYQYINTNYFYNLNSTFSDPDIICDMRMLSTLAYSKINMTYAGAHASILPAIWKACARDYGDR